MEIEKTQFSIGDLVRTWSESSSLKINQEYQRGAQWKKPQKQALIDSLLRNYPVPPLFLHRITSKGLAGEESIGYEVVDGQQRIRAFSEFFSDKFELLHPEDRHLKLPNSLRSIPAPWARKRFSDLEPKLQNTLKEINVDAFVIRSVQHADEVRDLFIRLQSGTALTRQQVRDAWPGRMGPYVEQLAGKLDRSPTIELFQMLDKRGMRSEDDRDRYDGDRQFCAQLMNLFLARESDPLAMPSVGPNDLDRLYHEYTTFDRAGSSAQRFESVLRHTSNMLKRASKKSTEGERSRSKFMKQDIFAAFLLIQDISRSDYVKLDSLFYNAVAKHMLSDHGTTREGKSTSGPVIANYYRDWREQLLPTLPIRQDPKRLFDEEQKQIIRRMQSGECAVCKQLVESEDEEFDHFPTPHVLGGRTSPENGRLVHKSCHPRGRVTQQAEEE